MPPRLPFRQFALPPRSAAFSTSCRLRYPMPPKKKSSHPSSGPAKKTLRLAKKSFVKDTKPPGPGERKAFRKRLVLSNTNAVEPPLTNISRDNMVNVELSGAVVGIPGEVVDSLRACGAFKVTQGWSNYKRPAFLMRDETRELAMSMNQIESSNGNSDVAKSKIICGGRKTGKSAFLMQAMTMAFLRDWIVINIPECRELTDAHTDYAPLPDSNPTEYIQAIETAKLLSRIAETNQHILSKLTLSTSHSLPVSYDSASTLYQFAMLGVSTPEIAWSVFKAFWNELTIQNEPTVEKYGARPPILLTADNISHLFVPSHYQIVDENDKLQPIHPFDLSLPKFLVNQLTGQHNLPNGGIVLGAMSTSDFRPCRPLEIGVQLALAKQQSRKDGEKEPEVTRFWNQLEKIDQRVLHDVLNLNVLELKGIPKTQARAMIEYWAMNGLVRNIVTPLFVSEKWTLSGGGVLGELENSIVNQSLRA